ncbi:BspA family leucine-rich repeat surface protein [Arenibacter echinorum]|uniref:Surface protein n=1 Tax=Arenibacter echinorum TaxID=440515 RepID=A0A327RCG4_9FLAO|nr:BspA family leucine-rich repeat surface protein [Arenibacter echinorum]RAJ13805.1 surface protein [Arenibacter echinorum]
MKNLKFVALVCAFVVLFLSCSKDDNPEKITELPEKENQIPAITSQTFSAPENITDEVTIGTVTATDPDQDELSFSIVANSDDLFEISATGVLSLATNKELDFETAESHEITVKVSDGELTAQAAVTITVEDIDDTVAEPGSLAFITTWKTTAAMETIEIPVAIFGLTYDYEVDWGDGQVSTGQTSKATHVYDAAGTYDVAITGKFPAVYFGGTFGEKRQIQDIKQWGNIEWESFRNAFYLCVELGVSATDKPALSKVTDLSGMFGYTSIENPDFSEWDVSGVTDMGSMFEFAALFESDISQWNVGNVTNMAAMFNGASVFNADLNDWNVSNVTNMDQMFSRAKAFEGDLDNWNVSKVTLMINMFAGATIFNGNISTWNVSSVEDFYGMFYGATAFNGNIGSWDVSAANVMTGMFSGAITFNQDLSSWDVSNVWDMETMFEGAVAFNMSLNSWDVSNVNTMEGMFMEATAFNGDISAWNVSSVTDMTSMFEGATAFNGNIADWNVASVEYMDDMFDGASVFNQNLGTWNITSVKDMYGMLNGTSLTIANYDATLKGWSELATVPNDIDLGSQGLEYCTVGETARTTLESKGWDIVGDSKSGTCK